MALERLHQIALKATDLDASIAFYQDVLGLPLTARFDPPGMAFFDAFGTRLLLSAESPVSLVYFAVANLDATQAEIAGKGLAFEGGPIMIHRDDAGQFGAAGEEEWMSFLRDPAGNLIGLAQRKPKPA